MRKLLFATLVILLSGCAGKMAYIRPTAKVAPTDNTITIERSRDAVWASSVPELGKKFFVINNLDKASGLMNISYTGDPERYIDCGRFSSFVKNARGERTYEFAGAKAQQNYEVMTQQSRLFALDRRMSLEGRVNLIFEELGPNTTRVTANTRYVVARTVIARSVGDETQQTMNDSITFNSGSGASFPGNAQGQGSECVSTGALEREILSAIR